MDYLDLLLKVFIFILCILLRVFKKFSELKKPFDEKKKRFSFKKDFWRYYWDNTVLWALGGALGALTASEIGQPLVKELLAGFPALAEASLNLALVAFCTLSGSWLFGKFIKD